MTCNDAIDLMVDYFNKILESSVQEDIDTHLTECAGCREEFEKYSQTVRVIKKATSNSRKGITAGDDFEQLMYEALDGQKRKSSKASFFVRRLAPFTAAIAALIALCTFTPVLAAIQSGIASLTEYAFGDRGIMNSIEKGYGQIIEKTSDDNDLKFTVHNFISDENRSVVLLSMDYDGALDEKADNLSIYGLQINDKRGRSITSGYSSRYNYNQAEAKLTGNIDLGRINQKTGSIVLSFDAAVLSRQEKLDVPIDLSDGTVKDINLEISLDTEVVRKLTIRNIVISGNRLTLQYDTQYTDRKYMTGGDMVNLVNKDGGVNYSIISSSTFHEDENTERKENVYDITGLDIGDCRLEVNYPKPVKVVNGDWKVQFAIKRTSAENNTLVLDLDKTFEVGGYELCVTKAVFTPSMTSIHVESKEVFPLYVIDRLSIKAGDSYAAPLLSGVNTSTWPREPGESYAAVYNFDPVYDTGSISLIIDSAVIPVKTDISFGLNRDGTEPEKSFTFEDIKFKVSYDFQQGDIADVIIERLGPALGRYEEVEPKDVYVTSPAGEIIRPLNDDPIRPVKVGEENIRIFSFKGIGKGEYTLHIDSIARYRDVDIEVKLK